jgi:glycogen debranching enzyme
MVRCKYIFKDENKCGTTALYNYKDEKQGKYCSKHKKENMIDVISKRCKEQDCETRPSYNYKYEKTPQYCSKHKKENMIDVKNKRCKNCNLIQVIKSNNFLCSYCNPEKTKKFKTKENEIKKLLELNNIELAEKVIYKFDKYNF